MKPTFDLYIIHGRTHPDEELQDWGPNGPTLHNVEGLHQTYGDRINVFFTDADAAKAAQVLTGWGFWDENALTINLHEEYVVCHPQGERPMYYGDWGLKLAPVTETQQEINTRGRIREIINAWAERTGRNGIKTHSQTQQLINELNTLVDETVRTAILTTAKAAG